VDRLAEIRARLAGLATPTPWDVDVVRGSWTDSVVSQVEPHAIVAQWIVSTDAAFIASAPDDIAWLLDEIERLRSDCRFEVREDPQGGVWFCVPWNVMVSND
jgi:hypothetical protein